jgi:hypothetical protein
MFAEKKSSILKSKLTLKTQIKRRMYARRVIVKASIIWTTFDILASIVV